MLSEAKHLGWGRKFNLSPPNPEILQSLLSFRMTFSDSLLAYMTDYATLFFTLVLVKGTSFYRRSPVIGVMKRVKIIPRIQIAAHTR